MQNHTKRSATDIRIAVFKKTIVHNKVVKDEDMRAVLKCSRATYNREVLDYVNSLKGLTHDVNNRLVGFDKDLEALFSRG